jgi:hypothetical protein
MLMEGLGEVLKQKYGGESKAEQEKKEMLISEIKMKSLASKKVITMNDLYRLDKSK